MRRALPFPVLLFLAALGPGQGTPPRPSAPMDLPALLAKQKELAERMRRIEEARIRIDLGLPVDPVFLRSLVPPGEEDPGVLRARYAKELDRLAALQARLKDLKVQAAKAPAGPFRRKARPLPAEVRPRPAPPGAAGPGKKAAGKQAKKPAPPPEREPAPLYQVHVNPSLLADALYRKGKFREALALYRRILAGNGKDTAALFREALCLEKTGKPGRALEILGRIKSEKAGTPWEKAAGFAEESILWRKHFDSLGPLPSVPEGKGKDAGAPSPGGEK